jgi:hypothetical protein
MDAVILWWFGKRKESSFGYPIGGFTKDPESVESEVFENQLLGGMHKAKLAGAIDSGGINFNAYFDPRRGKPKIVGVVNSMVFTPQFVLYLARKKSDTMLEGFFSSGVNYAGGNDIKGDFGKVIGSSLKFDISGEAKYGYDEVGEIPMELYTAGATAAPTTPDP